jgi:hypothetical protein
MMIAWLTLGMLTLASQAPLCSAPEGSSLSGEDLAPLCADGVVKDDGTVETGYGWVPSVVDGRYVQSFSSTEFAGRKLEEVCVCWLRTRADDSIEFEVQIYRDAGGRPEMHPMATFPARAEAVPQGILGEMYSVDTGGIVIPWGPIYIGVAWDASADQFFFVCTDKSDETPPVEAFFIDDRADEWASVFETSDPIFIGHKAIIVRAVGSRLPPIVEIPTLDTAGLFATSLFLLVAGIGALFLGRSRSSG